MKIAVYSHYFVPEIGAPSARIYDMAREWIRAGHEVEVATCFPNHPGGKLYPGYRSTLYQREEFDGIAVHRHWTYVTPNKGLIKKTIGHLSFFPSALLSARRLEGPDVVIGTSPTLFAAIAAERVAALKHRPFIMEVRDLWPAVFVDLGVLRNKTLIRILERLELWLYRRATHIVTVTEAFRQSLISRGVPAWKVTTIRNGADLDYWDVPSHDGDLRERLGLQGKFVALYIGAHGISQALGSLLTVARRLADDPRIQLLFVGEGAEKERLVTRAKEEKLRNVTFVDAVEKADVRRYYALADVCLVPLRDIPLFDAFIPSKMFEMMAMARPIVGSVRGEAAEILQNSHGAIVVPPEDSDEIASAIRTLVENPSRLRAMGEAGRQFVAGNFSRRVLAAEYLEVLANAITRRRAELE